MSFQVGDKVVWTSQSAGIVRTKVGEVVEVVPSYHTPKKNRKSFGLARSHESYIVRASPLIDGTPVTKRANLYWPHVSKLRPFMVKI